MSDETAEAPARAPSPTPGLAGGLTPHGDGGPKRGGPPPIAYPLLAIVFGGILVWSFSRILLTVNKKAAAAIALLTALNILIGAALVAYGRRVRNRPVAFPFLLGAAAVVVAVGAVASSAAPTAKPEGRIFLSMGSRRTPSPRNCSIRSLSVNGLSP